jgi:DNA-binding NtrC family response regulator
MPHCLRFAPQAGVNMHEVERTLLEKALTTTGWNVTRAAKLLGMSRDTLRYRMDKHQIQNSCH